ncbi:MAG: hypothetical protein FWG89_05610 [Treponema sp.]|nr:hypothetical protein [Treponema sp.]
MNLIKDESIISLVERISGHYRANISNSLIRPALLQLSLDKETWSQIENLTEKIEIFQNQGFHIDELYHQIVASAKFVRAARDVAPTLRNKLHKGSSGSSDRVLGAMAAHNFTSNIKFFADMLNDLYIKLVEIDVADSKGRRPVYKQIPELDDIGHQLAGI